MGGFIGSLFGGGGSPKIVYMPTPPAAPPPAPAANVDMSKNIKPVEGTTPTIKKPKTKGLLTGDTLGSSTLLGG